MDSTHAIAVMQALLGTVGSVKLYSLTHPQSQGFVNKLHVIIEETLGDTGKIHLDLIEDEWTSGGIPIIGAGDQFATLVSLFKRKRINRLGFSGGVTKLELQELIDYLSRNDEVMPPYTEHIYYGQVSLKQEEHLIDKISSEVVVETSPQSTTEWSWADLKSLYKCIVNNQHISTDGEDLAVAFLRTFQQSVNPLKYLADIKTEDEYTYVHTINVALLTMALAKKVGFSGSELVDITYAALMHDVGKMLIPEEVLNKPGALNSDELAIMRSHPVLGAQYIAQQKQLPKLTIVAALEHHIRYDGQGYPNLGAGWKPHIVSQMISVADIYDALRSRRPYREPLKHSEIVEILNKESGSALNPHLVELLIDMIK